jgi:hypothetical protein
MKPSLSRSSILHGNPYMQKARRNIRWITGKIMTSDILNYLHSCECEVIRVWPGISAKSIYIIGLQAVAKELLPGSKRRKKILYSRAINIWVYSPFTVVRIRHTFWPQNKENKSQEVGLVLKMW